MMKTLFKGFLSGKKETSIQILLLIGIFFSVNFLVEGFIWRWDLTEDNRYTLSNASRDIAKNVEDPITVTAYYSKDIPPQLKRSRKLFQNFLEEFRAYSGGQIEYKFVDPSGNKKKERKARRAGVRPLMVDVRKQDKVTQQRVYMGAVFKYHRKREVIPVLRPQAPIEYKIASTLRKLTIEKKPKIGVLQGHGEPGLKKLGQLKQQLSQLYNVTEVSGIDTTRVPPSVEVLMVVNPNQSLSGQALKSIDQYLMAGGKVIFAINRVKTNPRRGMASVQNTGIEKLLKSYQLPVKPNLLMDRNASVIRVQQRRGGFNVINRVRYPFMPRIQNFGNHPISQGLENAMFQFVSTLDTTQVDTSQSFSVLAMSSEQSRTQSGRFNLTPMRDWGRLNFNQSYLPIAAVLQGKFNSAFAQVDSIDVSLNRSKKTSIAVFGDGDFMVSGSGRRQKQLPDDNVNLAVNTVDWMAEKTGLMKLRTQRVTSRPLMNISDTKKTVLKYLNVFLPIIIVLGIGLYRYQRRKSRRRTWIEKGV